MQSRDDHKKRSRINWFERGTARERERGGRIVDRRALVDITTGSIKGATPVIACYLPVLVVIKHSESGLSLLYKEDKCGRIEGKETL